MYSYFNKLKKLRNTQNNSPLPQTSYLYLLKVVNTILKVTKKNTFANMIQNQTLYKGKRDTHAHPHTMINISIVNLI